MKSVLSTNAIKEAEKFTISSCGIDASVLMERAAVEVAFSVIKKYSDKNTRILVVCGGGNNGADGLCVARILTEHGYRPFVFCKDSKSELHAKQLNTLKYIYNNCVDKKNYDIFVTEIDSTISYGVIVDALYGIGINRDLEKEDVLTVECINNSGAYIYSVDIPSGLNSTTGSVMGACVNADETICLGYYKQGLFFNEGPDYTGRVTLKEIGIWNVDSDDDCLMLENQDISDSVFLTSKTAHKGTYGKVLVIAGSENIYGASFLAAKSALLCGAGMVKVVTHVNNRHSLEQEIPEALFSFYSGEIDTDSLKKDICWSDTIVIGPGLGTGSLSDKLMNTVLYSNETEGKKLVVDADGINLLSANMDYLNRISYIINEKNVKCVLTPHKGELQRLKKLFENTEVDFCKYLHDRFSFVIIDKGAHSKTVGERIYINNSGNDGMATAGSGDVLSGMLGGLLYRLCNVDFTRACATVVWLHGKSGDLYADSNNTYSLTATGIMNGIVKSLDFLT